MDVVIGASGHLGNVLTRELAARGGEVRPVFRSQPDFDLPEGVTPYLCDTSRVDTLLTACSGAETVYHTAALVSIGIKKYSELYEANVALTRRVIEACLKTGVSRLVYSGTIEAFDLLSGEYPVTEQTPIVPSRTVLPYGKTKALAVMEVERAVNNQGLNAVTVFPTAFLGPFDYKISAMTKLVIDFMSGRIPAGIGGGFDFVDARDVASGMILAAKNGRIGDRYMLPGSYATVTGLFSLLEKITGKPAPRLRLPAAIAPAVGFAAELYYLIAQRQPRYTRRSMKLLTLGVTVSGKRASERLAYAPRDHEQSLRDTIDWLVSEGFCGRTG